VSTYADKVLPGVKCKTKPSVSLGIVIRICTVAARCCLGCSNRNPAPIGVLGAAIVAAVDPAVPKTISGVSGAGSDRCAGHGPERASSLPATTLLESPSVRESVADVIAQLVRVRAKMKWPRGSHVGYTFRAEKNERRKCNLRCICRVHALRNRHADMSMKCTSNACGKAVSEIDLFWQGGVGNRFALARRCQKSICFGKAVSEADLLWQGGAGNRFVLARLRRKSICFGKAELDGETWVMIGMLAPINSDQCHQFLDGNRESELFRKRRSDKRGTKK